MMTPDRLKLPGCRQQRLAGEALLRAGWLLWRMEQEMRWLIRLLEVLDRVFRVCVGGVPLGQPWEQRCWALAIGLTRGYQVYAALWHLATGAETMRELQAAAARVRQQVMQVPPAA